MPRLRREDMPILKLDTPGRELVEEVVRQLTSRITVGAVVLFGSRARGDALDESDWDLAVVSSDFENLNPIERGTLVLDCIQPHVELVYFTVRELLLPTLSYLRCAVLEEGVPIVDNGAYREARAHYEAEKQAQLVCF